MVGFAGFFILVRYCFAAFKAGIRILTLESFRGAEGPRESESSGVEGDKVYLESQ